MVDLFRPPCDDDRGLAVAVRCYSMTSLWGKYQREGCNSKPDSRMFYMADNLSSGRSSFLSRDATELVPISGDVMKSSGRSLHFNMQRSRAGEVSECRV
jgi:hypothetical protein